jgi:hypothetical protein
MAHSFDTLKKSFDNLTGNPSNYTSWSENMESYLKTRREWLPVIGRFPEPEFLDVDAPTCQERIDHIEWQETKDSAAGTIFLCIDESQKDHICDCRGNPEQMWDQLKELHQQRKPGPRFNAYNAFFNLRKEEDESLTNLFGCITHGMAVIKSLRPSHFSIQQLDKELQCMAAIRALPEEYSGFTTSLFLLDKFTLSTIRAAFHNQEQNLQLRETTLPAITMNATVTSSSSTCQCTWCHRMGHIEDNCHTKKHSQQHD